MSDILPKVKLYLFCSLILLIVNLGYQTYTMALNNTIDIVGLFASVSGAFIPLASTLLVIFNIINVPIEVTSFIGAITGILSGLQIYLIIEIAASHIPLVDT